MEVHWGQALWPLTVIWAIERDRFECWRRSPSSIVETP
jgi:hypothetical protein